MRTLKRTNAQSNDAQNWVKSEELWDSQDEVRKQLTSESQSFNCLKTKYIRGDEEGTRRPPVQQIKSQDTGNFQSVHNENTTNKIFAPDVRDDIKMMKNLHKNVFPAKVDMFGPDESQKSLSNISLSLLTNNNFVSNESAIEPLDKGKKNIISSRKSDPSRTNKQVANRKSYNSTYPEFGKLPVFTSREVYRFGTNQSIKNHTRKNNKFKNQSEENTFVLTETEEDQPNKSTCQNQTTIDNNLDLSNKISTIVGKLTDVQNDPSSFCKKFPLVIEEILSVTSTVKDEFLTNTDKLLESLSCIEPDDNCEVSKVENPFFYGRKGSGVDIVPTCIVGNKNDNLTFANCVSTAVVDHYDDGKREMVENAVDIPNWEDLFEE